MSEQWSMKDVWKNNLTDEMFDFIKKEFNISRREIMLNDTFAFYDKLVDDVFDIEVAELPDDENEPFSDRCRIAVDIVNAITPCQTEEY